MSHAFFPPECCFQNFVQDVRSDRKKKGMRETCFRRKRIFAEKHFFKKDFFQKYVILLRQNMDDHSSLGKGGGSTLQRKECFLYWAVSLCFVHIDSGWCIQEKSLSRRGRFKDCGVPDGFLQEMGMKENFVCGY